MPDPPVSTEYMQTMPVPSLRQVQITASAYNLCEFSSLRLKGHRRAGVESLPRWQGTSSELRGHGGSANRRASLV